MQRHLNITLLVSLLVGLAGCGGGGGAAVAAPDPLAEVPASASQSSTGMAAYMDSLAAMPSDTLEPVALDNFSPPRPDNTEPEAISR